MPSLIHTVISVAKLVCAPLSLLGAGGARAVYLHITTPLLTAAAARSTCRCSVWAQCLEICNPNALSATADFRR